MSETTVTRDNFETEVINSGVPVLLDFWADWCGPCRMLGPVVAKLSEEYEGRVKVCKVNVDEQPELAAEYNVASIPTVIFFKNGKQQDSSVGFRPREQLAAILDSLL